MFEPGPMIAISATASSIAGSASTMSIGRMIAVSTHPPWYPAYNPSGTPTARLMAVAPKGLQSYLMAMPIWLREKLWTADEISAG